MRIIYLIKRNKRRKKGIKKEKMKDRRC